VTATTTQKNNNNNRQPDMAPLLSRWSLALAALASSVALVHADMSAADYYVHELPGAPADGDLVKMHAG
jgi:hypothetical protein